MKARKKKTDHSSPRTPTAVRHTGIGRTVVLPSKQRQEEESERARATQENTTTATTVLRGGPRRSPAHANEPPARRARAPPLNDGSRERRGRACKRKQATRTRTRGFTVSCQQNRNSVCAALPSFLCLLPFWRLSPLRQHQRAARRRLRWRRCFATRAVLGRGREVHENLQGSALRQAVLRIHPRERRRGASGRDGKITGTHTANTHTHTHTPGGGGGEAATTRQSRKDKRAHVIHRHAGERQEDKNRREQKKGGYY